jgi:hypothetical protein
MTSQINTRDLMAEQDSEPIECIDSHREDGCKGITRLDLEDRLRTDYPDTATPPEWFDPANAGEHWDEDY